jgi:WD40 repeat protein
MIITSLWGVNYTGLFSSNAQNDNTITTEIFFSIFAFLLYFLISLAYYIFSVADGQTLGNKFVNSELIDANGNPPGYAKALVRYVTKTLFSDILIIGYLWVLWDKNKQTLHDNLAGTICITSTTSIYLDQAIKAAPTKGRAEVVASHLNTVIPKGIAIKSKQFMLSALILLAVCGAGEFLLLPKSPPLVMSTVLSGHTDPITSVAWSPDGKTLASGSEDSTIRLWSADGKALATLGETNPNNLIYSVAWFPDSKILVSSSPYDSLLFWSADGKESINSKSHISYIKNLTWSPDGKFLAGITEYDTVQLWTARN